MLNRKEFLGLLLITVLISICTALFHLCSGGDPKKVAHEELHKKVTSLSTENITSIEIRFVKKGEMIDQKCILDTADINRFLSFLHNSDLMQVGGHNRTLYESIIDVDYKNNTKDRFIGEMYSEYEFNKDALYIYNSYSRTIDGRHIENRSGVGLPIRVPGLGLWLSTKCPLGKK